MLEFKKLNIKDIEKLRPFYDVCLRKQYNEKNLCELCRTGECYDDCAFKINRTNDCTIGSIVMWRNFFDTHYAIQDNTLFYMVKYSSGKKMFAFPLTLEDGSIYDAFKKIDEYCVKNDIEKSYCGIHEKALPLLESFYGNIHTSTSRDWEDYLYNSSDIVTFKGRKYSAQRNHINKFKKLYDWKFEEISEANIAQVNEFFEKFALNMNKSSKYAKAELLIAEEVIKNYKAYGFCGGIIKVDGKAQAVSMGEIVGDTLFVHIEKGNIEYKGIYQVMVNEFASHFVNKNIRYINREEDCGDEGLRKSKLSYKPVKMLKKYIVKI